MEKITALLASNHAQNIRVLDLTRVAPIADYFVIASGNSTPHLNALVEDTSIRLKKDFGVMPYRREGSPDSGWMVIDFGGIVVHVMLDEARNYYSLENLWNDAPDLEVDEHGGITFPKASARKAKAAPAAEPPAPAAAKPAVKRVRKAKAAPAAEAAAEPAAKPKRVRKARVE